MAIPSFTPDGILPPGIHECTLDEAKDFLATTLRRQELWAKLCNYLQIVVPSQLYSSIYIDGSYITDKPDPSDIDLVVHFNPNPPRPLTIADPRVLMPDYLYQTYSLDVYPCFDNLPQNYHDFTQFFQYIGIKEGSSRGMGPLEKKGIIKVNL